MLFVFVCILFASVIKNPSSFTAWAQPYSVEEMYDDYSDCLSTAQPPDPRTGCCGIDTAAPNRIVGGDITALEQYPWLALIEYKKGDRFTTVCGGFLISGRYVLTAAHCLAGKALDIAGTPVNVYLGEYNRTNRGPDCVTSSEGLTTCTDGDISIPIETFSVHPQYYLDNTTSLNDIGLIRLQQMAPYSEFIRPICLPRNDLSADSPVNVTLYTAGWGAFAQQTVFELGRLTYRNSNSNVKRHVDVPLRSIKECREIWGMFVGKSHVCAGGEANKDSCKGDSGGPLMYEEDGVYQAVGIVSFGRKKCGAENFPAVYTNTYEFRDWINGHIKE